MQYDNVTSAVVPTECASAAQLEETVKCRLNGRVRAFQLIVESQGLVLRGRTRTYYAKQLAQHAVMETCTVRILANDIEVVNGDEPCR